MNIYNMIFVDPNDQRYFVKLTAEQYNFLEWLTEKDMLDSCMTWEEITDSLFEAI